MLRVQYVRAFLLMGVLALSACASESAGLPETPTFSFTESGPLALRASSLAVDNVYEPPRRPPHVEYMYPVTPEDVARAWARDRVGLAGTSGTVRFRILEASVVEETLPTMGGIRGFVTNEQNRKLVARLRVALEFAGNDPMGTVTAEASATRTVAEHSGLFDVETDYYGLLDQLARQFDAALTAQLGAFLVSP